MGAEDDTTSVCPWWWEFSVPDIWHVWCQVCPVLFYLWLGGSVEKNKLYSDLDFVFMVEADERVASLFLLWGFTSTSGNDLLVP